jgi:hypothetical protein
MRVVDWQAQPISAGTLRLASLRVSCILNLHSRFHCESSLSPSRSGPCSPARGPVTVVPLKQVSEHLASVALGPGRAAPRPIMIGRSFRTVLGGIEERDNYCRAQHPSRAPARAMVWYTCPGLGARTPQLDCCAPQSQRPSSAGQRNITVRPTRAESVKTSAGSASRNPTGAASCAGGGPGARGRWGPERPRHPGPTRPCVGRDGGEVGAAVSYSATFSRQCASSSNRSHSLSADVWPLHRTR